MQKTSHAQLLPQTLSCFLGAWNTAGIIGNLQKCCLGNSYKPPSAFYILLVKKKLCKGVVNIRFQSSLITAILSIGHWLGITSNPVSSGQGKAANPIKRQLC